MALGLIQFLIGGKKKKSNSKSGKVAVPVSSNNQQSQGVNSQVNTIPDGVNSTTENVNVEQNRETQNSESSTSMNSSANVSHSSKKSISEALLKIHTELKESNERLTGLVTDVKKLEGSVNSLTSRVDMLDKKSKESDEKFSDLDNNMTKFLSLYELINNQYNPFVSNDSPISNTESPKIVLPENTQENLDGTLMDTQADSNDSSSHNPTEELNNVSNHSVFNSNNEEKTQIKTINLSSKKTNVSQSLLELDTLNIEEAAADCVPLTKLKNNTNGLVIILSWLEYLIGKVGIEESRNTLRYYTETLRWLTPEVFFDLDKYLRGMNDVENPQRNQTNVKDHIVSLYFISKLNEKSLDHRLTKAVLDIIQG